MIDVNYCAQLVIQIMTLKEKVDGKHSYKKLMVYYRLSDGNDSEWWIWENQKII